MSADLWVRRPGTCTARFRRTRAKQHIHRMSVDPPARTVRGRCAPKRRGTSANGTRRPISEIREGDQVLATNTETGETQARTVTETMVMHHDGDLLDLAIEDDDGQGVIQTTDRHQFWSVTDQQWEHAIDLDEGEQLRQADGTSATIVKLTERPGRQDMWDLTVDINHTFYVATGDVVDDPSALVHNCIRNQHLAGKNHPVTDVPFDAQGFPNFSKWRHPSVSDVRIQLSGNRTTDAARANQAVGLSKTPDGYVWHHHQYKGRRDAADREGCSQGNWAHGRGSRYEGR